MKEDDIRPENLFSEYLELSAKDAELYFRDAPRSRVSCPACKSRDAVFLFRKSSFDFEECPQCGTLYANPRPQPDIFTAYYSQAPSVKFWATHFYKKTEESRRELLIKPKAHLIKEKISRFSPSMTGKDCIIDIGAGYGVFCEELQHLYGENPEVVAIEPSAGLLEECRRKGIRTIGKFFEEVTRSDTGDKNIVAATSFELLEHLADPDTFLKHCNALLPSGALFIMTTLNWKGFDLQVLQEKSRSIQPPAHINFFTTESIGNLLGRHGFDVLEVTTPGKLDVDIVSKQVPDIRCRFIRNLIENGGEKTKSRFQEFLRDENLSSHMMVVAKKMIAKKSERTL